MDGALSAQVLGDLAELRAIQSDWLALAGRAESYSAAQGPDFVATAWATLGGHHGDRLAVIAVRREDELVGLWPLFVRREPRKSTARHLGAGADEEYAGPLIAAGPDAERIAARALAEAMRLADLLVVCNVPGDGAAAAAVRRGGRLTHAWSQDCPVVELKAGWTAWLAAKSKTFRYTLRHDRKLLAERGEVRSLKMEGAEDGERFVDWLFATKRRWLADRAIAESWLLDPAARELFVRLLAREGGAEAHAFALTVDGTIVAGCFCLASRDRLEFHVTAFDPDFGDGRPGNLLLEDAVAWAAGRSLDFDFRMMQATYKDRWADRRDRFDSFYVACTWKGALAVLAQKVRVRLRGG